MASIVACAAAGAVRTRRKQAKPQRKGTVPLEHHNLVSEAIHHHPAKHGEPSLLLLPPSDTNNVELNVMANESSEPPPVPSSPTPTSPLHPDKNHNEMAPQTMLSSTPDLSSILLSEDETTTCSSTHTAAVPEEVHNGLTMTIAPALLERVGGSAKDNSRILSATQTQGHLEDEETIKEYLRRSDTAVIYAEPVGMRSSNLNVPPLNGGGLLKEGGSAAGDDLTDFFIKCPQCQKGCQTFQALKEHMEAAHHDLVASSDTATTMSIPSAISPTPSVLGAAPGPFSCPQCSTSFVTKDQLDKHELLHSPNAQVSCKICNKTFANVYRLQRHMISHDESAVLRKFKCTECDKAFKFKHHLKEHIRIHSGEKPFECGNCGKRFSHSGSYSSHMTSKKCLVTNIKLGRTRTPSSTSLLDKASSVRLNNKQRANISPMNNNLSSSPNHNSYLPILPKYSEAAAAAFLQSSLQPFYLPPPGLINPAAHPISSYSMPSLGHLIEQLQQQTAAASPLRPPLLEHPEDMKPHETSLSFIKSEAAVPALEQSQEDSLEVRSSSCGAANNDLVMDEEMDGEEDKLKVEDDKEGSNGDLEAVKRILKTVNETVTKELLQANMQKMSDNSNDSIRSCSKDYEEPEHDVKSEGLAAKLEDALSKSDEQQSGEEHDFTSYSTTDEMDCDSVTTTEDGRKVRVRSLISDEQLKVLKDNYKLNPRPKREDLEKIASLIGFPVRVVQVWFQNTRARDKREGRLIHVPYSPARYALPPKLTFPSPTHEFSEQPLDLSITKKELAATSNDSSPNNSPHRAMSPDQVINLSRKSSRSPTPYLPYNFNNSNSSAAGVSINAEVPRQSPSPLDFNNGSRLAQILAQPAHKLNLGGMGLVPMDQLMQFGADLPSLSQFISQRMNGLSSKRPWSSEAPLATSEYDDEHPGGSAKKMHFAMKGLNSPGSGQGVGEVEMEGQFSCDQCDKSFSKQSSLARHKYEHSGQRPHKCNECPKAFKHKHHLTEHKRLHSGEKPFQCGKCLKRFSHSGSYSQHMNHRYSYCKPYRE